LTCRGIYGLIVSVFKKRFPVVVSENAVSKYRDKKVVFRYEIDGKLVPFVGTFEIHKDADAHYVCVDCPSFKLPSDASNCCGRLVYLSQAHTDSIIPAPSPDLEVDFVIPLPFESRHYIADTESRHDAP
jgi:hypothetical protein